MYHLMTSFIYLMSVWWKLTKPPPKIALRNTSNLQVSRPCAHCGSHCAQMTKNLVGCKEDPISSDTIKVVVTLACSGNQPARRGTVKPSFMQTCSVVTGTIPGIML